MEQTPRFIAKRFLRARGTISTYPFSHDKINDLLFPKNKLNVNRIKAEDAGTYICNAKNDDTSIDIPTVLVVSHVLPHFNQAPESYIIVPHLPNVDMKFTMEVSFKSEKPDGIILYSDESNLGKGDFIALFLRDGYPQFRYPIILSSLFVERYSPYLFLIDLTLVQG